MRVGLRQIYTDATRYPHARFFAVRWSNSHWSLLHLDDETNRKYLEYDREEQRLTQADYGGEGGWERVTVPMLLKASQARDPFGAFQQYGCRDWP